jgi:hypothetical protein
MVGISGQHVSPRSLRLSHEPPYLQPYQKEYSTRRDNHPIQASTTTTLERDKPMTFLNRDALFDELFRYMSTQDPREYDYQSYSRLLSRHAFDWMCEQWNKVDRRQQILNDSVVHMLVSPPISTDPKNIVYGSEVKIKQADFKAFCKAYNLDETKMEEVSAGKRREWKQWTRSGKLSPMIYGSPYKPPREQLSPGMKRKREQEAEADRIWKESREYKSPTQYPPITFNPDEPQPLPVPSNTNPIKSLLSNLTK